MLTFAVRSPMIFWLPSLSENSESSVLSFLSPIKIAKKKMVKIAKTRYLNSLAIIFHLSAFNQVNNNKKQTGKTNKKTNIYSIYYPIK